MYFAVTECDAEVELRLKVVRGTDDPFTDVDVLEIAINLNGVPDHIAVMQSGARIQTVLDEPGVYFIQLCHGDDKLMERRLVVTQPPQAPENPQ